jgi:hypothetical protein
LVSFLVSLVSLEVNLTSFFLHPTSIAQSPA